MNKPILYFSLLGCALLTAASALAKLPALSDDAKAKAAEAAAKTAWSGKVDAFQLCKAQDKVAAQVAKAKAPKVVGKDAKAAAAPASSCVDPGAFVYTPPVPAAAASAPAPAASAAEPVKKS
jgi:hypothetical protein